METREFDRGFVRFRAGVAEEGLSAEASFGEHLGPNALFFHIPAVGNVQESFDLMFKGFDDRFGAVSEEVAPPAGEEVDITVSFRVEDEGALAVRERDGVTRVVWNNVFIEEFNNFLRTSGHSMQP